ncbi:NUC153 domain-containing protein [Entamoeba marina]
MERKHNPKQFKGKKKGTNEKKPKDNRFKKDARFHHLNRKEKTKLDDRFASVLKGSEFRDGGKLDKYGRKIGGDKDIEELSENELEQIIENENVGDDVEVYMDQGVMEAFEEQEKENIPRGGSTNQIAIMNCDWESTTAKELYVLLSACLPTGGKLVKIEIRPSKFGMERMAQEEVEGLPKNLWRDDVRDMVNVIEDEKLLDDNYIPVFSVISDADLAKPNPKLVVEEREIDEMEEEDDDNDLGLKPVTKGITPSKEEMVEVDLLDKEKVVSYEQEKHKYYFGVAVFDSIETADAVYSAIDGEELEFAPESLDLRFIPDGTEFPYEPIDVCDKYGKIVSRDGKAKSNKIKITWDSTDERRKLALGKKWNEWMMKNY